MAGSAIAAGVVASAAALVVGLAVVGGAAAESQRAASVVDAAALAAADGVSGAVVGDACELAGEVAAAGGASVESCTVEGLIATVTIRAERGGLRVSATARAGPPPSRSDPVGLDRALRASTGPGDGSPTTPPSRRSGPMLPTPPNEERMADRVASGDRQRLRTE